jgi:hypothetical protein
MSESDLPRPNIYGVLFTVSLLAGIGMALAGGPAFLVVGFLGFAVVITWVAMRRSKSSEGSEPDDDGEDTEGKAKAEAGGATGPL